jgi:signal transduction histidine kinase
VNSGTSRIDFLREITRLLLDFSECNGVELRIRRKDQCFRCEAARQPAQPVTIEVTRRKPPDGNALLACMREGNWFDEVCRLLIEKQFPPSSLTKGGSFWTGNLKRAMPSLPGFGNGVAEQRLRDAGSCLSLAMIPLAVAEETIGLLQLRSERKDWFRGSDIEGYESVAQTAGLALVSQLAHASLRERIKELTCLYSLTQLAERPGVHLEEVFQGVVEILPAAWQYPEIAVARLGFDGRSYTTADMDDCVHRQSVDLVIKDQRRGTIEVGYTHEMPELEEGPFLQEERSLIGTVARQIALLVERREADDDKGRLQEQLRHADRLATIGQLSAGVAHELNEPLGNILAFAQLAGKEPGVPEQVAHDLDKIVATSLHAREIIKKLMLFARQTPPRKTQVSLNSVIEEGLYFLESRCLKRGVAVERNLSAALPEIVADPSQLNQVLVNLVVNAIQAMPGGGRLQIGTRVAGSQVVLTVEDTGAGMDQEVLGKIFTPFFTTKDIHEGTGLGLPVVHGIVSSHGGTIGVDSTPGRGTRFEICLPIENADEDEEPCGNEIAL